MPSRETLSLLEELLFSSQEDGEKSNVSDEEEDESDEEDYFYPAHPVPTSGARTARTSLEKNVICKVVYSPIHYGYDTEAYSNRVATFAANMIGTKRKTSGGGGSSGGNESGGSSGSSGGESRKVKKVKVKKVKKEVIGLDDFGL